MMVWMRCLNGPREQASITVALDEKNRDKLVKDKPARPEEGQLGEEKIESRDLVKLDAYERDEIAGRMISVRSLTSYRKCSALCKSNARNLMNFVQRWVTTCAGFQRGSLLYFLRNFRMNVGKYAAIRWVFIGAEVGAKSEENPATHLKTNDAKYNSVRRLSPDTSLCPTGKSGQRLYITKAGHKQNKQSARRAKLIQRCANPKCKNRRTHNTSSRKTLEKPARTGALPMHLIKKTRRYPNWNSEGTPKLEQLKMSRRNSEGTLEMEQHETNRVQGTSSWFARLVQEQLSDQAQWRDSMKSTLFKRRSSAVFKCRRIDKRSDQMQVGSLSATIISSS
ncbi:RNA polymerase beta'' chain [Dorcoceras hygrometricum]|uniref:RNA polymerase beta'' chain n=1 Tax=Dorcoceras hygrometricum TaxID=472368 RepID=A0A2Z7CK72_9LAMI|nr:RNA polymerase beta'' chain [Dorcoceras hygrometricum]